MYKIIFVCEEKRKLFQTFSHNKPEEILSLLNEDGGNRYKLIYSEEIEEEDWIKNVPEQ